MLERTSFPPATVAKWLEENPDASDTDLLTEFNPGLLRIRWAERR